MVAPRTSGVERATSSASERAGFAGEGAAGFTTLMGLLMLSAIVFFGGAGFLAAVAKAFGAGFFTCVAFTAGMGFTCEAPLPCVTTAMVGFLWIACSTICASVSNTCC